MPFLFASNRMKSKNISPCIWQGTGLTKHLSKRYFRDSGECFRRIWTVECSSITSWLISCARVTNSSSCLLSSTLVQKPLGRLVKASSSKLHLLMLCWTRAFIMASMMYFGFSRQRDLPTIFRRLFDENVLLSIRIEVPLSSKKLEAYSSFNTQILNKLSFLIYRNTWTVPFLAA